MAKRKTKKQVVDIGAVFEPCIDVRQFDGRKFVGKWRRFASCIPMLMRKELHRLTSMLSSSFVVCLPTSTCPAPRSFTPDCVAEVVNAYTCA